MQKQVDRNEQSNGNKYGDDLNVSDVCTEKLITNRYFSSVNDFRFVSEKKRNAILHNNI